MIKVISARCVCVACPTTYIGQTDDGCTIYARYRWGRLSVRIDPRDDPPHGGAEGTWIYDEQLGGEYHGCLDYADLRQHTAGLVEWPDQLTTPDPKPAAESTDPTDILTL
jgi:hypothetical protein